MYHADESDKATDIEDKFREAAIAAHRNSLKVPKDFDGETCYDCGDDIHPARIKFGAFRCITCQEVYEKKYRI